MNIAIDIQPLVSLSKYRGMGIYTAGLLNALFRQDQTENKYFLFNMYQDDDLSDILSYGGNVQSDFFDMGNGAFLLKRNNFAGRLQDYEQKYPELACALYQKYIKENNIDTFLITAPRDIWCDYKREWFEGANLAVIVYDLIPLLFSKEYLNDRYQTEHYLSVIELFKSADKLLAISGSVKADLIKHLDIPEEKIDVIYSGVDTSLAQKVVTDSEKEALFGKFSINGKYLIFPSAPDYRKNLVRTLEAYALMPEKDEYQLVVTGDMHEEFYNSFLKKINDMGLAGRAILTKYVTKDELAVLYNNASLLLFPSLYEGFGMPVIEAYACGLPVVTSNSSSLGEIAQGGSVLVDPYSKESIAAGVRIALEGTLDAGYEEARRASLEKYTWENTAQIARSALDSLGRSKKRGGPAGKLAFFADMNTDDQMLAACYGKLLSGLKMFFDVDVFSPGGAGAKLPEGVGIFEADEFMAHASKYPYRLYNAVNDAKHSFIYRFIEDFPGTLILHDTRLHDGIYAYYITEQNDYKGYGALLEKEIANAGEVLALMKEDMAAAQKVVHELPFTGFAVAASKNIVVATDDFKRSLIKKDVGSIIYSAMIYNKNTHNKNELYEKYGIPAGWNVVCAVGNIEADYDILPLLDAVDSYAKKDGNIYCIIEQPEDDIKEQLARIIDEKGMADRVKLVDMKNVDTKSEYLGLADVYVRLKNPPAGKHYRQMLQNAMDADTFIISLDSSMKQYEDMKFCEVIDFNDQAYHIEEKLRKYLQEEHFKKHMKNGAVSFFDDAESIDTVRDALLDTQAPVITEKLLRKIYREELMPRGLDDDKTMEGISRTFAYIMGLDGKK